MDPFREHERKCRRLAAEIAAARARGSPVALAKTTSNLFRHRDRTGAYRLEVRRFNRVLRIDPERMYAEVEGMTTYEDLVDATLPFGLLPAVVPQLKTITIGGAVSGLGIESSSFRYGLVHETVEEMEILLADGTVAVCSASENRDLFFGFPNSYGTLGYVLRLRIRLVPAQRFVHLIHERFSDPRAYFERIAELCAPDAADFLDGTVFRRDEMYVTTGRFSSAAPYVSDYTWMRIYYQSIPRKKDDWLTAKAYIWRWDTDWFWCSKHFHVQKPAVRLLAKWGLNSRTYQRIMRLAHRLMPAADGAESVIQDVDIPVTNAAQFLEFLFAEIGIAPVWICPFQACDPSVKYDLCPLDANTLYINFGFWDVVPSTHEPGHFNRKVERKARELGGIKGLYSTAYYDEETFWKIYDRARYHELKRKYDAGGVLRDLYSKCVARQ